MIKWLAYKTIISHYHHSPVCATGCYNCWAFTPWADTNETSKKHYGSIKWLLMWECNFVLKMSKKSKLAITIVTYRTSRQCCYGSRIYIVCQFWSVFKEKLWSWFGFHFYDESLSLPSTERCQVWVTAVVTRWSPGRPKEQGSNWVWCYLIRPWQHKACLMKYNLTTLIYSFI